ncbi:MAG: DUF6249 domain-containing protein [Bacteroidota bacterium]
MSVAILGVLLPIIISLGAFVMVVYLRKYANIERLAAIEKGISLEEIRAKNHDASVTLRFALLLVGAGIGLLFGYFLDHYFYMEEVAYFSMLLIFGGLGLGIAYIIEEKKMKDKV